MYAKGRKKRRRAKTKVFVGRSGERREIWHVRNHSRESKVCGKGRHQEMWNGGRGKWDSGNIILALVRTSHSKGKGGRREAGNCPAFSSLPSSLLFLGAQLPGWRREEETRREMVSKKHRFPTTGKKAFPSTMWLREKRIQYCLP